MNKNSLNVAQKVAKENAIVRIAPPEGEYGSSVALSPVENIAEISISTYLESTGLEELIEELHERVNQSSNELNALESSGWDKAMDSLREVVEKLVMVIH